MFDILDVGASGLMAQRVRMDTIAQNVASMNVTHGPNGEKTPYRRRFVSFMTGRADDPSQPGVRVDQIHQDMSPFQERYDPGNPDSDPKTGMVKYPNIDLAFEMVNMMEATRAYEANVNMMEVSKAMINASLRLIA